jgi:hypothetical protein
MTAASPSYSGRGWLGRPRVSPIDVVVAGGVVVLLWGVIRLEQAMGAPSARLSGSVSLGISNLPYYRPDDRTEGDDRRMGLSALERQ